MTRTLCAVDGDQTGAGAESGQAPPHNIGAEQVVLGAAMLSPAALVEVRAVLDGSEFYRPAHQVIWQAITALADRGDPPRTAGHTDTRTHGHTDTTRQN